MFADNGTKLMPLLGVSGGEGKQDRELLDVMASQFAMEQGDVVTTEARPSHQKKMLLSR